MGVGIGGMITGLMGGDPTQQIAAALAGPNPNPMAGAQSPTGAPGPAGAPPGVNAPPQAPQLPPAQAYAPDPANASVIAQLLKVHQNDLISNDINRNIQLMSSGFGTAQQQHDKMALVNGAGQGGGDTLNALGEIQKLQSGQLELENKQRFQASADLLGQTFGLKPGQGGMLSSDPELFNTIMGQKVRDQSPTDLQKNISAYETQARAAGIPEEQIQSAVQMAFTGALGGPTRDEKNMQHDISRWQAQNPGKDPSTVPQFQSLAAYKGYQEDIGKQAEAAGQEKMAAKTGLPGVLQQIKPIEDNISQMFGPDGKVKPEVIKAIQTPDVDPGSTTGAAVGALSRLGLVDPAVLNQKAAIAQLQQQLSANAMAGMKNIRTQREFNVVGGALTSATAKINDTAKIQSGLESLRDRFLLAKQNALAAGGGEIDPAFADKVDKDYLNGGSLDNGATIAKPIAAGGGSGPQGVAPVPGAKQAPDGNWYVPDPARPGKYLRVD